MNVDTGAIRDFGPNEQIPARYVPLTSREATYLRCYKEKDRTAVLKRLRKQAIRATKRAVGGRRLANEEMEITLGALGYALSMKAQANASS
jgi:hypothetical protein